MTESTAPRTPHPDWTLRDLRFFLAVAEEGSFTEAALRLFVSQAAVSRTVASFERTVGDRLFQRVPHGSELTESGLRILPEARRVLAEADRFTRFLGSSHGELRLGYSWAALGGHTTALQRTWQRAGAAGLPDLRLVHHNSPTSGLLEGHCDVAVMRTPVADPRLDSAVVGLERRLCAFAADDGRWRRRRVLTMAEIAERTVVIDPRTGTTSALLWADAPVQPRTIETYDVDVWLDTIAAGRGVGTTAEATAHHHARADVRFLPVKDSPRIPVHLAWLRDRVPPDLRDLVTTVTGLYG
jgi:DNA-binding transcriptional LysR family regulator